MPKARSFLHTSAIVLKRRPVNDADQVVTLFTEEKGKFTCLAKGVRKLGSRKVASIEPGNIITAYVLTHYQRPLLTECALQSALLDQHRTLPKLRQLQQILEIIDRLTVEEQAEPIAFIQACEIIRHLHTQTTSVSAVREHISTLLAELGYNRLEDAPFASAVEYVSFLSDRPLHSVQYLTLPQG
jgi:DNA repair protein RecO (recombination protein O)